MSQKLESIQTWLDGPQDYASGLQLYLRYGRNEALKSIFGLGQTSYNEKKLLEALRKLLHETEKNQKAVSKEKKAAKGQSFVVDPRHPELVKLYRQRAYVKSQICVLPGQQQRKEAAFQVLHITEHIERILFTGFPEDKLPTDRAELVRLSERNRKYLSRYRQDAGKADEVKRREHENELIRQKLIEDAVQDKS